MIYIPRYFKLYELLPEEEYDEWYPKYGEKLWLMFPSDLLVTADMLREEYGPMTCNDWFWRKDDPKANHYRGYRPMDCLIGAELSDHKWWRALDLVPKNVTADAIRMDCVTHEFQPPFTYITAIEDKVSWFHFAIRNHIKTEGIQVF